MAAVPVSKRKSASIFTVLWYEGRPLPRPSMVVMDGSAEAVGNPGFAVAGGGQPGGLAETGAVLNEKRTFTVPPARRGLPQDSL
jgi:hypothetical protein